MSNLPIASKCSYFEGEGHSDITEHAGSYHLALHEAGIHHCNIMPYSSILPGNVTFDGKLKWSLVAGSELKCIISQVTVGKGETGWAALGMLPIYEDITIKDCTPDLYIMVERHSKEAEGISHHEVHASLNELYEKTFSEYDRGTPTVNVRMVKGTHKYNTAILGYAMTEFAND